MMSEEIMILNKIQDIWIKPAVFDGLERILCRYKQVVRHIIETRNEQEIELHTTYFDTELLLR